MSERTNAYNAMSATLQAVGTEIWRQLGARRFGLMVGAKDWVIGDKSLSFRLPNTPHFVKDKINFVRIVLEDSDLYTVTFGRIWGTNVKDVSVHEGIYNDMLVTLFETETGLATRL